MKRLTRDQATAYVMEDAPAALQVEPGEVFCVETKDCFGGVLASERDLPVPATLGRDGELERWNPCAGPIYVDGARPGDLLVVEVHDIVVAERGVTAIFPGIGPLADSARYPECRGPYTRIIEHEPGPGGTTADGFAHMAATGARWPLNPHVGTIGTAPLNPSSAGSDTNLGQGPYGGNIDCREVAKGNRVLLPVAVEGACLYLGDVHASMGDGELYGTADEAAADITLSCTVVPGAAPPWARVETSSSLVQLCSARPVDDAVGKAFGWMQDWLVLEHGFAPREAYIHLCCDSGVRVAVYQMVDIGRLGYTVGVSFPKASLLRAAQSESVPEAR